MPTRRLAVAILTFLPTLACASHTAPATVGQPAGETAVVAALTRQADAWDQAILRKDLPAIEGNMAPDFRQIRSNGQLVDRATFLHDIVAPELVIDPYTVEALDVRIYGDVALLSGTTHMTGSYAGEAFATDYRYTDTYVRRGGKWQVVSVQITTIRQ
jgi:ketosteroid isomerase-like protein